MDAKAVAAAYVRGLGLADTVTVSRPSTSYTATVRARITEYQPHELAGGIVQGDRKGILLTADLSAASFPLPLLKGDKLAFAGKTMTIQGVDDGTRRVAGVSIALDVHLRGA